MPIRSALLLPALLVAIVFSMAACGGKPDPEDFVVRVGDQVLSQSELSALLSTLSPGQDSLEARTQIIEQWVTNELLALEAVRRGLREDSEVQRLLRENERSVLINRLFEVMTEEDDQPYTNADVQAYYDRHREQLRLREPFVRLFYLQVAAADSASEAARQLQLLSRIPERLDNAFPALVERFSVEPEVSRDLADSFFPESRLMAFLPEIQSVIRKTPAGQSSGVIETDDLFHVVLVRERIPQGAVPELAWVEDEIRLRLEIQGRKQMHARQVQRLRNEALARETLVIRQ
jgi:hypothetical protein